MNDFVEPIFNLFKVKFDKIDELELINKEAERVIFYINLENVFTLLLQPRIDNQLRASGASFNEMKTLFISSIINLGQHYRLYACARRKNLKSKIVLYWNYPRARYKNRDYITKYRDDYDGKMFRNLGCTFMTEVLSEAYETLKTTMTYINEVYLVGGGEIESSLIPYVMEKEFAKSGERIQNVIVSKSVYDYMYLAYPQFVNLIPAKDKSFILTAENVIEHMKSVATVKNPMSIPVAQLPTLISIIGDQHRGIQSLKGYGIVGAIKCINAGIQEMMIGEETRSYQMLREILPPEKRAAFERNYPAVSFEEQYANLSPTDINSITSQIIDKCQDDVLKEINESVFKTCPLMIVESRTEQIRKSERFQFDVASIFS